MADCRAEFIVEPFEEGSPGPHVKAAVESVRSHGLEPEIGAFGTVVEGSAEEIASAVSSLVEAAFDTGASRVSLSVSSGESDTSNAPLRWEGDTLDGVPLQSLEGALAQLVAHIEGELGSQLADLSRVDKQAAVRMLDERGAFSLRGSVEDVAKVMGVSRITIYNYLNAIRGS